MSKIIAALLLIVAFNDAWAENAKTSEVIYGISPYYFSRGHAVIPLQEITRRLPEMKELGVTILWLQPVMESASEGQSYDTVDHFKLNPKFGNEEDLKNLVKTAHQLGLRVILDVALNHVSLKHPFALDYIQKGKESEYSSFFQSSINPEHPYSEFANHRAEGKANFVFYFWDALVNLDYANPIVQNYAIQVLQHWVQKYDVDGYRLDASWGPQSRWPEFYSTVSKKLKLIKPNIFLLAEDKAGYPKRYEDSQHPHLQNSGFSAAYNWNSWDPDWMSKWSFQTADNHEQTVFNHEDPEEAADFFLESLKLESARQAISPVRYIENNDTGSFLHSHHRKQTQFAAAVNILLPGIPLLFYGQELGISYQQWHLPSIDPGRQLSSYDPELWKFYQSLIRQKKSSAILSFGSIQKLHKRSKTSVEIQMGFEGRTEILILNFSKLTVDSQK